MTLQNFKLVTMESLLNNVHYKDYQALTSKRDSCIEMTIYGSEGGSFGVISSIVFTENHNDTGVLDLQIC